MIGYQVANQLRVANCGKGANQMRQHQLSPSPSPSPKLLVQLGEQATSSYGTESTMINRALIKRECETATTTNELSIHRYSGNANLLDRKAQQDNSQMSAHLLYHHHQHRNHLSTSPGYHSAASSPCSTADSPVSSSSSSGISSASHSSSAHLNPSIGANNPVSNGPMKQQAQTTSMHHPVLVSPFHLMDYFPEINNDGLNLSWAHEANSRAKLSEALSSTKMIISGDIALAEMSRYPVPIMARAPVGVSDLTLENWIQEVTQVQPQRAIKLTFTSTRTVEPAFRVLARHAESLKGPLILSADILSRVSAPNSAGNGKSNKQQQQNQQQQSTDNQSHQPVDAWTFLMMCRTKFPKCTISIGWCPTDVTAGLDEGQQLNMTPPMANASHASLIQSNNNCHLHANVDQMFDLDMMIDSHQALSQLVDVSHLGHLQHLSHQQNRHHQSPHPYPLIHHQRQHSNYDNQHLQDHRHNQHHRHHLAAHQLISSAGSLGSSSGNSSGSPSPTSPISQLLTPPYQMVAANLSLAGAKANQLEQATTEQLLLNACVRNQQANGGHDAAAAAAAAAAMTAALVAASKLHQQQQQQQQQLPLNLNINEADQQQIANVASNSGAARQFLKQQPGYQSSQLNLAQTANDSLASRLFGSNAGNNNSGHIHKKIALGGHAASAVSGRSCSPQSTYDSNRRRTSPKLNRNHLQDGNLLLKTTIGNTPIDQHTIQQPKAPRVSGAGYTREMIDKMASIVKEYNLTQPVTFPVEARCLLRNQSLSELQRLLYQVGSNSTLTIVAQHDDLIGVDDLLLIRRSFAANQLLFDLPERLVSALRRELD